MNVELSTPRLFIKSLDLSDAPLIYNLLNTDGWKKFIGDKNIQSIEDAANYISKILENKNYHYFVFSLKEVKAPLGLITFLFRDTQDFPDLGFAILPQYEGFGYAYEAAQRVLEFAKEKFNPKKIIAILYPENSKSINLLTRLNFKFQETFIEGDLTLARYIYNPSSFLS